MRVIGLLALLVFSMWALQFAQTGNEGTSPSLTIAGDMSRVGIQEADLSRVGIPETGSSRVGIPDAPIGHRQPRASDTPNNNYVDGLSDLLTKENSALNRKIKSICRGC
jgi:hypothetical protein